MATRDTPPWKKRNPVRKSGRITLTDAQKKQARARAEAAGRPYPNLVDNMAVAKLARKPVSTGNATKKPTTSHRDRSDD